MDRPLVQRHRCTLAYVRQLGKEHWLHKDQDRGRDIFDLYTHDCLDIRSLQHIPACSKVVSLHIQLGTCRTVSPQWRGTRRWRHKEMDDMDLGAQCLVEEAQQLTGSPQTDYPCNEANRYRTDCD